jgi:hypothetical protein
VFVALFIQHTKRMRLSILSMWHVRLCCIFPYYLINGAIFGGKKLLNPKYVLSFSLRVIEKYSGIKCYEKLSSASRVVSRGPIKRWMNRHDGVNSRCFFFLFLFLLLLSPQARLKKRTLCIDHILLPPKNFVTYVGKKLNNFSDFN